MKKKQFEEKEERRKKVEKIARSMVDEYRQNTNLVALTSLDGEDFKGRV